ncbi:PTS system glucose-specific IIA component/PTS system N-acetylglucosamine-specific IIA component [Sediminihabitans luteus]|uniref:PTS system glucose-specific IIA component/PTS system N-acetylglucosamine-specific IIA component n=1 Tax=Sediminihabitans luteus TaxID=1138585 RepID=A0A2M9CY65_9CELL|nr:PTS glucose transporter subunit IIA [Sediminihabitans luteus]PJJ76840.1 PTS system glucose-specific IIA component/PTS system N-acetylglucosamine-specific IIA component [Sediminihabitans luteus]GIJ00319.1 PTS glucose transporter subunit IIA [Sediminihabitans luteus]
MQGEQRPPLVLVAPVGGRVVALTEVSDPVFAQQIAGPGVAVVPPAGTEPRSVLAPVAGRVVSLLPHAFAVESADGRTVLVHLGLGPRGAGNGTFSTHVDPGEVVDAGAHLVTWTPDAASAGGACPVVALQGDPALVALAVPTGSEVEAGEAVLRWT